MYEVSGIPAQPRGLDDPTDPRLWSRENVANWLKKAASQYQLGNTYPEKFPMNGRGLLLLTKEMFLYRVPEGGAILYEDLQFKLQKAFNEALEHVTKEALANVQSKTAS